MLFRPEALASRRDQALGKTLIVRPVTLKLMSGAALVMMLFLIGFLVWGTYTKRTTVSGVLLPEGGLIRVYTPRVGVVSQLIAQEGMEVKAGAKLAMISNELQGEGIGPSQAYASQIIAQQGQSLREELERLRQLNVQEQQAKQARLHLLELQIQKIGAQIKLQQQRTALLAETRARFANLHQQDFVSREQLRQKEIALLESRAQLEDMQVALLNTRTDYAATNAELDELPITQQKQVAEIERQLADNKSRLADSDIKREIWVVAPVDGAVTAVAASPGSQADISRPLLSLIPSHKPLYAELYVPSQAIGFVRAGDTVKLRYQAFPYQTFGLYQGTVASISRTALPANDIMTLGNTVQETGNSLFYRVSVRLDSQMAGTRADPRPLLAGMQLEADILQETLPLYQWLLEPLRGLTQRF